MELYTIRIYTNVSVYSKNDKIQHGLNLSRVIGLIEKKCFQAFLKHRNVFTVPNIQRQRIP